MLVDFFILLTLGVTWNLLAGYAGLVSVGQQAYIGIGAYGVLWLAQHGIEPFVALPIAAAACAVLAVPISFLVFRLRGGYFAIGTWAVAEVLALLTIRDSALGGGTGTNVPGLGGFDPLVLGAHTYWAALAVAVISLVGSYFLLRTRVGLALTAVRDDETAARNVGVHVPRAKRIVYLAAAVGAGGARRAARHQPAQRGTAERVQRAMVGVHDLRRADRRHRHARGPDPRHHRVLRAAADARVARRVVPHHPR